MTAGFDESIDSRPAAFFDDEDIADFQDAGLQRLNIIAHSRRQDHKGNAAMGYAFGWPPAGPSECRPTKSELKRSMKRNLFYV